MNIATRRMMEWLQLPALLFGVVELTGCSTSSEDACDPDPFTCTPQTVQLCNDNQGNVYWLVSDGTRFDCGSSTSGCTSSLISYCQSLNKTSVDLLNKELGDALIQERQRRIETEKLLQSLSSPDTIQ